jgi:hypothetical protein
MGKRAVRWGNVPALAAVVALALGGCIRADVERLAADAMGGRNNGTPGSLLARDYLVERLSTLAEGANPASAQPYLQPFSTGANIVGIIPGTDLADEYVVIGAHYDHVQFCDSSSPGDVICNGATDNATGVAAALAVAAHVVQTPVRRSVVIALWDAEEDGLVGSQYYVQHPLVPLADTVAYLNFDILGANLRPTLRDTTFLIGAETGGPLLSEMTAEAATAGPADTTMLSAIFGQFRSDYASFMSVQVPVVFFSDSSGPCYHTVDDEIGVVDFGKLDRQVSMAVELARAVGNDDVRPTYEAAAPLATFADVVAVEAVVSRSLPDAVSLPAWQQAELAEAHAVLLGLIADGPAAFDGNDHGVLFPAVLTLVDLLSSGPCSGFLAAAAP